MSTDPDEDSARSTPTEPDVSAIAPKVAALTPAELAGELNRVRKPSAKQQRRAVESIAEDLGLDVDFVIAAGNAGRPTRQEHTGE